MAYSSSFLRLVASGSLYTVERFSWSLSLAPSFNNDPLDAPDEVPQAVIDAVSTFHGSPFVTQNAAKLDQIKLNLIGTDGRYVSQTDSVTHDFAAPVSGSGSNPLPAQVANAVTLRTAVRRGRGSTGRFYIPVPGSAIGTNGLFTVNDATAVATAATTMLSAINAAIPGFRVAVMSNVGAGVHNFVTHVSVGRVPDTIRSRRASLREEHVDGPAIAEG